MHIRIFIFLFLILSGCGLLRSYDEQIFSFNYDSKEYKIVSKIQGDEVLENVLLMYNEEGEIVLEGVDEDSNGKLDEIQKGNVSLSEANRIYYVGLEQAFESGNFDSKNELRVFERTDPPFVYSIETFGYDEYTSRKRMVYGYMKQVDVYNDLTIAHTEEQSEKVLRDVDADGRLDTAISPSDLNHNEYQEIYSGLLNQALEIDRMMLRGDMYIVLPIEYN